MTWRPEQLEEVPCDSCGGSNTRPVVTRPDGMRVVECAHCGLAYLNPRPKADQIHLWYDGAYFGEGAKEAGLGYQTYLDESVRAAHKASAGNKLDVIGARIEVTGRRALEIGCATGEFCQALHERGGSAVGIDLSPQVIALAKARYPHLDLRPGDLQSAVPGEKFQLVFAWEVVEHLTSPGAFFAELSRRLEPSGYVVLSTPNYACTRLIQPERWAGFLHSFEHLYFFDRRMIGEIGTRHGLRYVISYSGGGAGLVPGKQPFRSLVRKALSATGTLQVARRARAAAHPHGIGYTEGREDQHNLIVILQQDSGREARN